MHRAMSEFEGKAENRRKFLRLTPPDARIEPAGQISRPVRPGRDAIAELSVTPGAVIG
jgi:hypothetical protein